jgi:hypothetical protein
MEQDNRIMAFTLGADLGQSQDYTAIALIEQEVGKRQPVRPDWRNPTGQVIKRHKPEEAIYTVTGVKRLELQTPYPEQVREVQKIFDRIILTGRGFPVEGLKAKRYLAVDRTGVGRPVVNMFETAGLDPIGISITGGDTVTEDGNHFRVPKRELVNLVKVLLQQGRLKISGQIPEYRLLVSEMNNFTYKINDNANDVYGREGQHDDLLLALAVGLWVADYKLTHEKRPTRQQNYLYPNQEEED